MEALEQIKADLLASKDLVTKVAADVNVLHTKIDALQAGQVTEEQLAELKGLSGDLVASLKVVDEKTPEENTSPAEGTGGDTPVE